MVRAMANKGPVSRILRIEPGISLFQWAYDRIANNWAALLTLLGASGMSLLAAITDWTRAYGVFGVAGVGVGFALLIWLVAAAARNLLAKAAVHRSERAAIERWQEQVDSFNPLDVEFHKKRIKISELAHPVSNSVSGKKITDCELIGPANLFFLSGHMSFVGFRNCTVVVARRDAMVPKSIVISMDNNYIHGGEIWDCVLMVPPELAPAMRQSATDDTIFATLTGVEEIDSRLIGGTAKGKQP